MTKQYDLVVIGTGTGASGAAARCRSAGWSVAVIDHARRMRGHGIAGGELNIACNELMTFKRSFTEPVPGTKEKGFAKNGIDAYHGRAKFCGPRSVEVGGEVL